MKKEDSKSDILKGVKELLVKQTNDVKQLLNQQTDTILNAVDEKISAVRVDMVNLEIRIDKKLEAMEERWSQKFDKLTTTLDNFLKRMTDMEEEFTMMRHDLNRMKKVIKEK